MEYRPLIEERRRMKRLPFAAIAPVALTLGAVAAPAMAQTANVPAIAQGNTLLTVTGQGESTREPDIAMFTAGVSTTGKTAGEALSANSTAMTRVIAALKRAGIAERDIQTSNLSLNPVYGSRSRSTNSLEDQMPPILGYNANNTVRVKQRKLEDFGKVIDTLVSAGANSVNGPSFSIDKPDAARNEARTAAIREARERADLYARAAGLRVVRIVSINEGGGYSSPMPVAYRAMSDMAEAAPAPPVAPGEVSVNAGVTVQFELAP
jgi:hypothetical protein